MMMPADGVEHDGARVAALVSPHHLGVGPLSPGRQLLGRRGAERVTSRQDDRATVFPLLVGDLADGRRLADTVDADEQPHVRAVGRARLEVQLPIGSGETILHLAPQRVQQLVGLDDLLVLDLGPQTVEQVRGDADPHIGPQQRLLEVVPRLVGDPATAAHAGEGTGQGRPGAGHPLSQRGRWDDDLRLHGDRRLERLAARARLSVRPVAAAPAGAPPVVPTWRRSSAGPVAG